MPFISDAIILLLLKYKSLMSIPEPLQLRSLPNELLPYFLGQINRLTVLFPHSCYSFSAF